MSINFLSASFKDFENIPYLDIQERASTFQAYLDFLQTNGHLNYRLESFSACSPEMEIIHSNRELPASCISFVSNDYLGFTQHPKIKEVVKNAIDEFGAGSGASPAIGGYFTYHRRLEEKIAHFFKQKDAILYTTGYAANSATIQCLLKKEDIAIVDMAVHASVHEGCQLTNVKTFMHNHLDGLEMALKNAKDKYRTKMVIIDGIYSQDGDEAYLDRIEELTHYYGGYLMVDDAHGVGVVGNHGRGLIEKYNLFDKVDFITGTFSKALGNLGGYVVANTELINFLKYQSRQHLFSTSAGPSTVGIIKAIELIDEEPIWKAKLWGNINYLKTGLLDLGFDVGATQSAIIPVKIGSIDQTLKAGKFLLSRGIFANPIMYPAVAKKDARLRINIMATHSTEQIDALLNTLADMHSNMTIEQQ